MVFSSPIFLFLFLPVVLALCALPGLKVRNGLLLLFSVIFYAWGEVVFVFLMLASTVMNHFLGQWVDRETEPARRKWAVAVAVALNIGTLAFFKYANFAVGNLNALLWAVPRRAGAHGSGAAADWDIVFHVSRVVVCD
jgi:alginate O-acetyltransferase complex protein AlgI